MESLFFAGLFIGYFLYNISLIIYETNCGKEPGIWKDVFYFLFGTFYSAVKNLIAAFKKG